MAKMARKKKSLEVYQGLGIGSALGAAGAGLGMGSVVAPLAGIGMAAGALLGGMVRKKKEKAWVEGVVAENRGLDVALGVGRKKKMRGARGAG